MFPTLLTPCFTELLIFFDSNGPKFYLVVLISIFAEVEYLIIV